MEEEDDVKEKDEDGKEREGRRRGSYITSFLQQNYSGGKVPADEGRRRTTDKEGVYPGCSHTETALRPNQPSGSTDWVGRGVSSSLGILVVIIYGEMISCDIS